MFTQPVYEDNVMLKQNLIILVVSGSLGLLSGNALASDHAYPRTHAIQSMDGNHIIGWHLMTPEEKREHQHKMEQAKTPEEREEILRLNHMKMEERAKQRGVPLREMPPGQEHMMNERNMPHSR